MEEIKILNEYRESNPNLTYRLIGEKAMISDTAVIRCFRSPNKVGAFVMIKIAKVVGIPFDEAKKIWFGMHIAQQEQGHLAKWEKAESLLESSAIMDEYQARYAFNNPLKVGALKFLKAAIMAGKSASEAKTIWITASIDSKKKSKLEEWETQLKRCGFNK